MLQIPALLCGNLGQKYRRPSHGLQSDAVAAQLDILRETRAEFSEYGDIQFQRGKLRSAEGLKAAIFKSFSMGNNGTPEPPERDEEEEDDEEDIEKNATAGKE